MNYEAVIRSHGAGAAKRFEALATSASAGNASAKKELERLTGKEITSMLDIWEIISAATSLMTKGEIWHMEANAQTALHSGRDAKGDADAYLANRLGSLRKAAGMTQAQLSQASGVNLTTLQKLENGTNRLLGARTEITLRLAKALNITVEDLVSSPNHG